MAQRYEQLSLKTRRWLEGLRDDDIDTLNQAIKFQEQAKTVGRFGKWLLITFAAIIFFFAELGQAMSKLLTFLTTGKWPSI